MMKIVGPYASLTEACQGSIIFINMDDGIDRSWIYVNNLCLICAVFMKMMPSQVDWRK